MAETPKDKAVDEAITQQNEKVAKEVEQHKAEDVDLEDVSGGMWSISYTTDAPA
jgi:hypothetical protein